MAEKRNSIALAIAIPLLLSFVAWLASFTFTTFDDKRKNRLNEVREQIVDLYGPMYSLSTAHDSVWNNLGTVCKPDFSKPDQVKPEQLKNWRTVLQKVIQPLNSQMETTFLASKQLIRCASIRTALHQFVTYAESVKVITSGWEEETQNDTSKDKNKPAIEYPSSLSYLLCVELYHLHDREKALSFDLKGLSVGEDLDACPLEMRIEPCKSEVANSTQNFKAGQGGELTRAASAAP